MRYIIILVMFFLGCHTTPEIIGNIPQCNEWSEESVEQLENILANMYCKYSPDYLEGQVECEILDISALEIELGRMEQLCHSLKQWQN